MISFTNLIGYAIKCYEGSIWLGVRAPNWTEVTCANGINYCKNVTGGNLIIVFHRNIYIYFFSFSKTYLHFQLIELYSVVTGQIQLFINM